MTIGRSAVVVGTDSSPESAEAVRWAAEFAARNRAPLTVVAVIPPPSGAGLPKLRARKAIDMVDSTVHRVVDDAVAAAAAVAPGLKITPQVAVGPVAATLLEFAATAGTVVLGVRGRGGVGKGVLGAVSHAVVQYASSPVVLVRSLPQQADGHPVVVGVDGSAAGASAVQAGFSEASLRGAPLVAVHSWSDVPMSVFAMSDLRGWYDERTVAELVLAEQLAGYEADYPDVPVQRVVAVDRPHSILQQWSEVAQLVVIGARGRGGVPGMRLGSIALKVLRSARCPVLVTR